VVDTIIKAIEKEYPGLKQHQMVKFNKKIVAVLNTTIPMTFK
jgi:hypothetical protein